MTRSLTSRADWPGMTIIDWPHDVQKPTAQDIRTAAIKAIGRDPSNFGGGGASNFRGVARAIAIPWLISVCGMSGKESMMFMGTSSSLSRGCSIYRLITSPIGMVLAMSIFQPLMEAARANERKDPKNV